MKKKLLSLLQKTVKFLAEWTIRRYEPLVVGITGNVGKTSAREAVYAVLKTQKRVRASSKNFNNELGLPLSIIGDWESSGGIFFWAKAIFFAIYQLTFKNSSYPEVLVLEYGVDREGDMRYLVQIARPAIGVFTAMGETPVHIEFFRDTNAVITEKSLLLSALPATGFAILNADDPRITNLKDITRAGKITFGFSERADVRIKSLSNYADEISAGVKFKLSYGTGTVPVKIEGAFGRAPAYACAIAAATGLVFGTSLEDIAEILKNFTPPKGRQRIIDGIKYSRIIDDTYNASPLSMEEALHTLASLKAKRKIAVLGDMLELGKHTLSAHGGIGKLIPESADLLFTVGTRGKIIAESAMKAGFSKKKILSFMSIYEAGMQLQQNIRRGDLVLIKGSQGVRMERIVKEVMAEPAYAKDLLVRQDRSWLKKEGIYDSRV